MSGRKRITDWKGKLRDWDRQDRKKAGAVRARATGFSNFEQRDYDMGELERQLLESQNAGLLCDAEQNAPAISDGSSEDGSGEKEKV